MRLNFFSLLILLFVSLKTGAQFTYVINSSGEIFKIDLSAGCNFSRLAVCPVRGVTDMAMDAAGNFYVCSIDSLFRFDAANNVLTRLARLGSAVNAMAVAPDGNLYLAGRDVFRYDVGANNFISLGPLPNNTASAGDMVFYKNDLFLSAIDGNLYKIDLNSASNSKIFFPINSPRIYGMTVMGTRCFDDPNVELRVFAFENTQGSSVAYMIDMENKIVFPNYCQIPVAIAGSNSDIIPTNIASKFSVKEVSISPASCEKINDGRVELKLDIPAGTSYSVSLDGRSIANGDHFEAVGFGSHKLRVLNQFGCKWDTTINVGAVYPECVDTIYVPTAFTPNGDGLNDVFRARGFFPTGNYDLMVYNRYGQLVFHARSINQSWDGKINGVMQGNGTYVWHLRYTSITGTKKFLKGTLQLIR